MLKYFDTTNHQMVSVMKKQPAKEMKPVKKEPGLFDIQETSVKVKMEMDPTPIIDTTEPLSKELVTQPKCYLQFQEEFGESLLPQLPSLSSFTFKRPVLKEKEVSLADADSHRTGEEMLQEFLTHNSHPGGNKSERIPFMKMESTTSSDMEVSNNSDERSSYEGDDSHLTVKATVSDPSKGIKLFISKKRSKGLREEETKKKGGTRGKGESKRKRQDSLQSKLHEAFEITVLKPRKSISFGFSPVDWKGNPQNIYRYSKQMAIAKPFAVKSEYRKLCLSIKPFGQAVRSKSRSYWESYSTSCLEYML